jgi:hypothetical protein
MRYCRHCRKDKEESEFNANSSKKDGKQGWCRECTTEYNHRWYEANRERHRKYVREHDPRLQNRTCKECGGTEPDVTFYIKKEGERYYYRFICMECEAKRKKEFPKFREEKKRGDRKRSGDKNKKKRRDPRYRAQIIVKDYKSYDKKKKRDNDLTVEFVKSLISNGCSYCGDTELQMSLDRIDNNLGHLQSNVNAACRRCNWLRRDMPYEAWMRLVPAIRETAKEGLFGDWHAGPNKHKQFQEEQKELDFGCLAQEDEQQSFKLQDETSSVSAPTN